MSDQTPIPHVHTSTCWQETRLPECYEHRINELEGKLFLIQTQLRDIGGSLDKTENLVKKILQRPKIEV